MYYTYCDILSGFLLACGSGDLFGLFTIVSNPDVFSCDFLVLPLVKFKEMFLIYN